MYAISTAVTFCSCCVNTRAPEFDMSELESLFSAAVPNPDAKSGDKSKRASLGPKSDKVHLVA